MPYVTFDRGMLMRLKKALAAARGREFVFEGNQYDPGYAKYMIEHLENEFGKRGEETTPTQAAYARAVLEGGDLDEIAGAYAFFSTNHGGQGSEGYHALSILSREFAPGLLWRESNLNSAQADAYDEAADLFGGAPYERMGQQRRGPMNGVRR